MTQKSLGLSGTESGGSLQNHSLGFYLNVPSPLLDRPISYFVPTPISKLCFDGRPHYDNSVHVRDASRLQDSGLWWLPEAVRAPAATDEQLGVIHGEILSSAFDALNHSAISCIGISRANGRLLGKREPSSLRQGINWVGGNLERNRFVPPPISSLNSLMDDYCKFLARSDAPRTIKTMFAFVQFIAIHPFSDANGRTARLLAAQVRVGSDGNVDAGVLTITLLGLQRERHFHAHEALRAKRISFEEHLADWHRVEVWATRKASEAAALEADRRLRFNEILGGDGEGARRLYLFLRRRPVCTIQDLTTALPGSEKGRLRSISTLSKANWVQNRGGRIQAIRFLSDRRLLINELTVGIPELSVVGPTG